MKTTTEESEKMIKAAGGLQAFAKLLDPANRWESNTLLWWKKRGIPSDVQLEYYERLQKLRKELL